MIILYRKPDKKKNLPCVDSMTSGTDTCVLTTQRLGGGKDSGGDFIRYNLKTV